MLSDSKYYFEHNWNDEVGAMDGVYHCEGKYAFTFKDPAIQKHSFTVIRPGHLQVITNETGLSLKEVKELMIEDWFAEQNIDNQERANRLARERRARV